MKLGILGDVHANRRALEAALALVRTRDIDKVVFMGDLLSYGADVGPVLEIVGEEVRKGAALVLGNHDWMYLEAILGRPRVGFVPTWFRETMTWTAAQIDPEVFKRLPFEREIVLGGVYFAHANPFGDDEQGIPDWRYLSDAANIALAAAALRGRGFRIGVFGHTHRTRIVEWPSGVGVFDEERHELLGWSPKGEADALVVNAGAVGQPRSRNAQCHVAWVERTGEAVNVQISPLHYDVQGHLDAVSALPFSPPTIERLLDFFSPELTATPDLS